MNLCKGKLGRRGVSEVVGTVLTAAMTIIAGAAIFGFVNGQAGISAQAYGNQVGNSVQYLEEKFTVVDVAWGTVTCGASTCATLTIWIYNTGKIQVSLLQIRLYDKTSAGLTDVNLLYNYSLISGANVNRIHDLRNVNPLKCGISGSPYESPTLIGSGSFAASVSSTNTIQLTIPPVAATPVGQTCPSFGQALTTGTTYYFAVSGLYGNSFTYGQVR